MTRRIMTRVTGLAILAVLVLLLPTPALAQTTQVVEYYHTDVLGSVRAVTNQQGQVIRRHDFLPFGEELQATNPPPDKPLFTGKERDAETGLDYFGARYQRAGGGRFTSVAPLQTTAENLVDPQRWNRYAYARDNPLRWVDPDGRSIWSKLVKVVVKTFKAGNAAAAVADDIQNIETVFDGDANTGDRLWAAAELASEVLPISIGDAKTVVKWAARADDAVDGAKSATSLIRGGESVAAAAGRRAHSNYGTALGGDFDMRVALPSGRRPDAVDWANREVRELKPNNANAIRRGWRQVERYRQELVQVTGQMWRAIVDVHK